MISDVNVTRKKGINLAYQPHFRLILYQRVTLMNFSKSKIHTGQLLSTFVPEGQGLGQTQLATMDPHGLGQDVGPRAGAEVKRIGLHRR